MNPIQRIKNEYNEPATAVIKDYAEMGYSQNMTAKILGIDRNTLVAICERHNLTKYFKPPSEFCEASRPGGHSKGGMKKGAHNPKKKTYSDEFVLEQVRKYGNSTVNHFRSLADISVQLVYQRFGSFNNARLIAREG